MVNFLLDIFRAVMAAGIVLVLARLCRSKGLCGQPGVRLVNVGFWFLLLGSMLDISENFPSFNSLLYQGNSAVESGLEAFSYIFGFVLILLGFWRLLPVLATARQGEQLQQTILDAIPAPVFYKDENGIYMGGNQAFAEFLGLPLEKILGQTVFGVAPKDLAKVYHQADLDLMRQGGKQVYEAEVKYGDGTLHGVIFQKAVFEKEDGSPGGIVGAMLDITERKEAEETLREFDRMKNEFISTAAHELRTPLATAMGYTELLRNLDEFGPFEPEQQKEFLIEIYQRCEFLSKLIDDLLDVSRIEQGVPIQLRLAPCHPFDVLKRVVDRYSKQVSSHIFETEFPDPESLSAMLDKDRIVQVLDNLLSNAVKYSPEGGTIKVGAQVVGDQLQVIVQDQGIGMTKDQLARVFDKFYRVDASSTAVGGLGLGMSIAKHIVEEHGGTIEISSTPGHGTEVRFSLDIVSLPETDAAEKTSAVSV